MLLSRDYKDKKEKVQSHKDLSESGQLNRIEQLFQTYRQQVDLENEFAENRYKIAKETLEAKEKNASIADFSDKDLQYVLYMIQHANNTLLLGVLEEYSFNPFLIKLINARDSKLPNFPGDGKFTSKLFIEHPLKHVIESRTRPPFNHLQTKYRRFSLDELVSTQGVASIDPWAEKGTIDSKSWT